MGQLIGSEQTGTRRQGRPRVLHVIDTLGRVGGAEEQLVQNLTRFSDAIEHRVLCLRRTDAPDREGELPGHVEVAYVSDDARPVGRVRMVWETLPAVRRAAPDLIHCALPDAALAARLAGRILGVPVVESLVNLSHEPVRTVDNLNVKPWKLLAHRALDRVSMRGVVRFHALSGAVAESWSRTVGIARSRIVVIPRGVDTDVYRPVVDRSAKSALRVRLGLDADAFVIVNVGRQVAQKGQLYLIRAMPDIVASVPEAVLLIAGSDGPMSDSLRDESIRLDVTDRVRFVGVRHDIPAILGAADAFVFSSLFEGLGVSLLQAMACGLPCVVSDVAPLNEVVENELSGLTVTPRQPGPIARQVVRLRESPGLMESLGDAARKRVCSEFELDTVAADVESLYRSLLPA